MGDDAKSFQPTVFGEFRADLADNILIGCQGNYAGVGQFLLWDFTYQVLGNKDQASGLGEGKGGF